jgi:aspartyl-tRNA(Asn)/glutamyl-tRNA(Gln) amidotransferase subunit B
MKYDVVIGLEIHAQLNTKSKIFSQSSTKFGADSNMQANIVDLALPGTLPVLNKEVVKKAIKFGLATNCIINNNSIFERKNYFYPDLPKAYQISQFEMPIVGAGKINIIVNDKNKSVGITRAHLEEDAGKSLHENYDNYTGIDLNRAGIPLLEIVSEPDLFSSDEAVAYAKKIHAYVKALDICDGNMQEGSFRCDANISLKPVYTKKLGTRTEIKNINSFKFLKKAIDYEITRQAAILNEGGKITQETRLYNSFKDITSSMRTKEESNDYRYFPDPDLLPVVITDKMMQDAKNSIGELPDDKIKRFVKDYNIDIKDADFICSDNEKAQYFEDILKTKNIPAKLAANWIIVEIMGALNKENKNWQDNPISYQNLTALLLRITDNSISNKIAKNIFKQMWKDNKNPDEIIQEQGLKQMSDNDAIKKIINIVIANNPKQVQQYKEGKTKVLGFFVGLVMKESRGTANPAIVNQILKKQLLA